MLAQADLAQTLGMNVELRSVRRGDAARLAVLLTELGYLTEESEALARLTYWLDDPAQASSSVQTSVGTWPESWPCT